jgi:hypothetical protein
MHLLFIKSSALLFNLTPFIISPFFVLYAVLFASAFLSSNVFFGFHWPNFPVYGLYGKGFAVVFLSWLLVEGKRVLNGGLFVIFDNILFSDFAGALVTFPLNTKGFLSVLITFFRIIVESVVPLEEKLKFVSLTAILVGTKILLGSFSMDLWMFELAFLGERLEKI